MGRGSETEYAHTNGTVPAGWTLRWGCEFASPYDSTGRKYGSNTTSHVHDFALTFLLPSPKELELTRLAAAETR